ncbi:hypothetical protein LUZ63_017197 [Rhynchospora breviuscula]|uniref:Serine/threonine-protein phosphatase 4 regulatory subunit 3-like central domain-containing protein n=1 Tax=Rhynchospora breviuscula TaxID=2022672 RepID=A0A9Q0C206_9POAL|nr:hypothetical protein LUZ63_017197 [Rhynchospora breviuscula]
MELKPVDLSSLPLLLKIILECKFSDQMRIAELITRDNDFFPKLVGLFKTCEDSENIDGLHMIYRLVRGIILISNLSVYDRMFCDEFFMGVVGALGYDPEEPKAQKYHSLLENVVMEHVIFKETLPVSDRSVYMKLYQSIGAEYIKDVILRKTLDEVTIASLTLLAHAKYAVACSLLLADTYFIQELLAKLKSDGTSPDSKRDLVLLLCELWSFCENVDNVHISDFWCDIVDGKTYNITVDVMQAVIVQKDERCLHRIVERNLFRLIIEIFYVCGYDNGIVHGGVLELLEYITEENMEVLVIYLWETFSVELEKYESFKSIQALKIKYKQCIEERKQETENKAKGAASNRGEDGGLNKLEAKDEFKMDSWTSHFHSFYRRFICRKKKVD